MNWALAALLVTVLSTTELLAQTPPPAAAPAAAEQAAYQFWATIIGQLGIGSILAWFLYHQTSVAGPAKDRENREALKELNKENNDTVRAIVDEVREDREKDRQARREDIAMLSARFRCDGSQQGRQT